jgi:hypothetical protein
MNLATMHSQFAAHTSGLADDLASGDITGYLDLFHKWIIPADVDGTIGEVVWNFILYAGTDIPTPILDNIVTINQSKAWIFKDYGVSRVPIRLTIEWDYLDFTTDWPDWQNDSDPPSMRGLPDVVCFYGGNMLFNRVPLANYAVGVQCRGGPAPLTNDGINDDILALATVTGAAWIYLQEKEDADGAAREGGLYDIYKNLLNTRSGTRYQRRRRTRTF